MKSESPKLLRVSKAAHELGLHPFTVRKWIKQGKIHAVWVGQEARVPRSEIERLVGKTEGRLLVLYGRVSGIGQRADLETQLARLQAWASSERAGAQTLVLRGHWLWTQSRPQAPFALAQVGRRGSGRGNCDHLCGSLDEIRAGIFRCLVCEFWRDLHHFGTRRRKNA